MFPHSFDGDRMGRAGSVVVRAVFASTCGWNWATASMSSSVWPTARKRLTADSVVRAGRAPDQQRRDAIEQSVGDLALGEQRQFLRLLIGAEQDDAVGVAAEAAPLAGDVVGDDQIEVFLDELLGR